MISEILSQLPYDRRNVFAFGIGHYDTLAIGDLIRIWTNSPMTTVRGDGARPRNLKPGRWAETFHPLFYYEVIPPFPNTPKVASNHMEYRPPIAL